MSKNIRSYYLGISCVLVFIGIILAIIFLMQGSTTVSGEYIGAQTSNSLSCRVENRKYDFFTNDPSVSSETKINVVFSGNAIGSASLVIKMQHTSENMAKSYRGAHMGDMDISFGKNGLRAKAFNIAGSYNDTMEQISLYATKDDFSGRANKYFLLPDSLESFSEAKDYEEYYAQLGFTCETKE